MSAFANCGRAVAHFRGKLSARTFACLLNYLMGTRDERMRYGKPQLLGGLEIDGQLEFGYLVDRDVAGLCSSENCVNRRRSANRPGATLLWLCACKSALGCDGLKIATRFLLVPCCAAAASGHATAPHTTRRKARRLMSTPSLGRDTLLACEPHSTPSDRHQSGRSQPATLCPASGCRSTDRHAPISIRRKGIQCALKPGLGGRQPWNAVSAFANCGRAVAHIQGSYAPQHYSISASARASSDGGTGNPSALAVLRLIANWYFVGACAGRLAGFSPFKMRST